MVVKGCREEPDLFSHSVNDHPPLNLDVPCKDHSGQIFDNTCFMGNLLVLRIFPMMSEKLHSFDVLRLLLPNDLPNYFIFDGLVDIPILVRVKNSQQISIFVLFHRVVKLSDELIPILRQNREFAGPPSHILLMPPLNLLDPTGGSYHFELKQKYVQLL